MKSKQLLLVLAWLAIFWAGWHILPHLFESRYDCIAGASGGGSWGGGGTGGGGTGTGAGGGAALSLVPIPWMLDSAKVFQQDEKEPAPVLIFFTTEEDKSISDKIKLGQGTKDIVWNVFYLMVVLETDKTDKEKDDLEAIKRLLKSRAPAAGKPKAKDEPESDEIKKEVELGAKYQIKSLPQVVWADCYGNELQKGSMSILSSNTPSLLRQEIKTATEKQKQLRESLEGQAKALDKDFKTEKDKGVFSKGLITKLQKVAPYDGYEPSKKAKGYLEEINKVAEQELDKIIADADQKTDKEKQQIVSNLSKFEDKYKGLAVTEKAKETRESLAPKKPVK